LLMAVSSGGAGWITRSLAPRRLFTSSFLSDSEPAPWRVHAGARMTDIAPGRVQATRPSAPEGASRDSASRDSASREAAEDAATRVFSTSILISATRCVLTYVVFPWLLPLVGVAGGVGPVLGMTIGTVAIGFNVASIRRFHRSGHRWRWPISALNVGVILLLLVAVAQDIADIAS
jgi:hypothetical protein